MKKTIIIISLVTFFVNHNLSAQAASSLTISDTRNINDLPNSITNSIKADFKQRELIGVPGSGIYCTNLTFSPWSDNTGGKNHQLNLNDGGLFYRNAYRNDPKWGNWRQILMTNENGSIGLGTTATGSHKLAVEGSIGAREIKVQLTTWSDFVFKRNYNLPTLEQVEKHITEKGHLENIPNEEEVLKNGINLGEMNVKLLQKIEELTLYLIAQNKRLDKIEKENEELKKEMSLSKK
ncbi:hypothetical protein [Flavobacterium branchiicola]|uniref:Uncharacterized protein n=1 Tax=Flavobacterium branchiicola TaxID=1114875 RepID=A0ABV9PL95_9FLAO|nr:hypothetical protein [Flavobacterium branchiicola]